MRIITLTLNPAFDVHCFAKDFRLYRENFVQSAAAEAGGKGVNLSRALASNGILSEAVVIVGRDNAEQYLKALARDGLNTVPIYTDGAIRENLTIHEADRPETRISFNGFSCDREILKEIEKCIGQVDENTVIAFTGSVSKGIDIDDALELLRAFKEKGARIVIDSRSVSLEKLIEFKPWLIKPNKDEAEGYTGKKLDTAGEALSIAEELHKKGIANALITLGGEGAVLVNDSGKFYAKIPAVDAKSTIGAGDSTIAGFIDGAINGLDAEGTLKRAVSYGTAAVLREGTLPPLKQDIEKIEQKVSVG